jgi:hypothetical protein
MVDQIKEYLKLHILSLEQDLDKYASEDDTGYLEISAAISTSQHILSYINELDNSLYEGV